MEQICRILCDALKTAKPGSLPVATFSTSDLQMDSIEDLETHGRSATNFTIRVSRSAADAYGNLSIDLSTLASPRIYLYLLDSEGAWSTYSKVKAIFEARQFAVKNVLVQLPGWFQLSLYILAMIFPFVFLNVRMRWLVVPYLTAVGVVLLLMLLPSRVSFVRSHERSKLAVESRKGYIKAITLLFLGAAVTKLLEIALRWVKAH